jgi:hypothetical protein
VADYATLISNLRATLAQATRQLEELAGAQPPVTPPPTTSSVIPANAKLVGALDFETGDLSQWANVQNKDRNGSAVGYSTWRASVRDGGPGHTKAARFEVRPGDVPNFGGGERSEVTAPGQFDVREGDETYYAWSSRFGDDGGTFPPPSGWGLIVMQWHSDEGSPPLSLHVDAQGRLSLENDRSGGYAKAVGSADAGKWHDYVLRVKWARNNTGLVEMWRDGQKLASYNAWNTVNAERNYLKMGIYRDNQSATHVVWHDNVRVYKV